MTIKPGSRAELIDITMSRRDWKRVSRQFNETFYHERWLSRSIRESVSGSGPDTLISIPFHVSNYTAVAFALEACQAST